MSGRTTTRYWFTASAVIIDPSWNNTTYTQSGNKNKIIVYRKFTQINDAWLNTDQHSLTKGPLVSKKKGNNKTTNKYNTFDLSMQRQWWGQRAIVSLPHFLSNNYIWINKTGISDVAIIVIALSRCDLRVKYRNITPIPIICNVDKAFEQGNFRSESKYCNNMGYLIFMIINYSDNDNHHHFHHRRHQIIILKMIINYDTGKITQW